LERLKVHIIHVGHMANKGTRALLTSDLSVIREIGKGDVDVSVSTTDIEGVRRLGLPLSSVLPTTLDVPYEKADTCAKKYGFARTSLSYKIFALASLLWMFGQILASALSLGLVKSGLKPVYRGRILARVKDCDIIVSCSDENFKESASMLPLNIYWILTWWSLLISRTWEILVAKSLRKPVVMFPNSVGPFRTQIGRILSKIALNNCDFVLVREPISYEVVKSLRVKSPATLTYDTTLLLNSQLGSSPNNESKGTVGVSAGVYSHSLSEKRIHEYISAYAAALDKAIEKHGFSVVFLPHYVRGFRYDDLEVCRLILSNMKRADQASIVNARTVEEFRSLISQMSMVISSKMHPSVLAASAFVPSICVAYDHKQTGFFMTLGMNNCVIPFNEFSSERLLEKIDYAWSKRDDLRRSLLSRVPELQKDIKESIEKAMIPFIHLKNANQKLNAVREKEGQNAIVERLETPNARVQRSERERD